MFTFINNLLKNLVIKLIGMEYYKNLDYQYTNKKYRQLLDRLPSLCVVRSLIVAILLSNRKNDALKILLQHTVNRDVRYQYVSLYLYLTEDMAFGILYVTPLKQIPLYLNHKREDIRSIAKWRLDIGR